METRVLTKRDIILGDYHVFHARKVAADKIRPFTQDDVDNVNNEFLQDIEGVYFFDLEGRRHDVVLGKCLVIGTSPDDRRATTQEKVERYRIPISSPDTQGFRLYRLKHPRPLSSYDIPHPFDLDNDNGAALWQCRNATGGYVVWDGDPHSSLRVIQREIFDKTYERD